jgi:[ribosomal protein S5]-alanine N-acetyltransferase
MNLEKPIFTESLVISVFQEKDCTDEYIAWLNDPEVNRFLEVRFKLQTFDLARRHIIECLQSDQVLFCKIEVRRPQIHLVGTCTIRLDRNNKVAEVGIMLGDRKSHGLGYAQEVMGAIKGLCFDYFDIRKLYAKVYASNAKSINLFKRSGFVIEAVLTDYALLNNALEDVLVLSCPRSTNHLLI